MHRDLCELGVFLSEGVLKEPKGAPPSSPGDRVVCGKGPHSLLEGRQAHARPYDVSQEDKEVMVDLRVLP